MKRHSLLMLAVLIQNALAPGVQASELPQYTLECRESYISGMLPTAFAIHKMIPVHVITQQDINDGTAYSSELGTVGGKLETAVGDFKVTATVLKEEPWLQIIFPDGTVLFNNAHGKEASSIGALPQLGKTAHKITCQINR